MAGRAATAAAATRMWTSAGAEAGPAPAVVGPNAILQTAAALRAFGGEAAARAVFASAGLGDRLAHPPADMVPEAEVRRLFDAVLSDLAPPDADAVLADSGQRTGAYILANRIPAAAVAAMRALPAPLAARLMLAAIVRHAWTFAGSGRARGGHGRPPLLTIAGNPLATPGCRWHAAVLEALFRAVAGPGCRVVHRTSGAEDRFEILLG